MKVELIHVPSETDVLKKGQFAIMRQPFRIGFLEWDVIPPVGTILEYHYRDPKMRKYVGAIKVIRLISQVQGDIEHGNRVSTLKVECVSLNLADALRYG